MNKYFIDHINNAISEATGKNISFVQKRSLSGGCINEGLEYVTNIGSFFLKINSASRYPKMFETEAKGLQILAQANIIRVPNVICFGEYNDKSYLVLEFINSTTKQRNFWSDFGRKLALLHQQTQHKFGLDHDNYIGSIQQKNTPSDNWTDFYVYQRLLPLAEKAQKKGLLSNNDINLIEKLILRIDELYPHERPALLHGDLWSGNVMTDHNGLVCLIDPAVYYGHREMDISFSTLFGAFPSEFYNSYNDVFPLEPNWPERIDLWNIYPLLVHLVLFGSSYYGQLIYAVKKYL